MLFSQFRCTLWILFQKSRRLKNVAPIMLSTVFPLTPPSLCRAVPVRLQDVDYSQEYKQLLVFVRFRRDSAHPREKKRLKIDGDGDGVIDTRGVECSQSRQTRQSLLAPGCPGHGSHRGVAHSHVCDCLLFWNNRTNWSTRVD